MRTGYGTIKCRGTRRCLRNGTETGDLWGIRVTVANPQRVEVKDMAANNKAFADTKKVPAIELRNITKTFGKVVANKNVNLELREG